MLYRNNSVKRAIFYVSVGSVTSPRRQSGALSAFECYPSGAKQAATSRILDNLVVIPIL